MRKSLGAAGTWMLASSFTFALMGALTGLLADRCHWLVVATIRVAFMCVVSLTMVRIAGEKLHLLDPPTLWLRSLAGSFNMICNFYSLTHMPLADATTLFNVNPIWILVFSILFFKHPPRFSEFLCVATGLAGVVLIEQPHLAVRNFAAVVALLSSLSTAVAMLGLHRLKGVSPWAVVAHFAMVSTVISSVWLFSKASTAIDARLLNPTTIALILAVGLLGTIGQVFLTKAYAAGAPPRVAVIGLMQVVFAIVFEILILHGTPSPLTFLGFAFVLAPTAWLLTRNRTAPAAQQALEG